MFQAFLLTVLAVIVFAALACAALVGVFSYQLARSNRVRLDAPTTAPLVWLWTPTQPAKLHRRLRAAVRPMTIPTGRRRDRSEPGPHVELMATVASQAVAIDHQVVIASRLSRQQRRGHLRSLTPQVAEIERLSLRLMHQQRLAAQPANIGGPHRIAAAPAEVLTDVSDRLDRLDEAHQELLAIERDNGLLDPDEVLARLATPPPLPGTRVPGPDGAQVRAPIERRDPHVPQQRPLPS